MSYLRRKTNAKNPPVTHRNICALLELMRLAMYVADSHQNTAERKLNREWIQRLYLGADHIRKMAEVWARQHGMAWPTEEYKRNTTKKPKKKGGQ